jgi:hypothetical protein
VKSTRTLVLLRSYGRIATGSRRRLAVTARECLEDY